MLRLYFTSRHIKISVKIKHWNIQRNEISALYIEKMKFRWMRLRKLKGAARTTESYGVGCSEERAFEVEVSLKVGVRNDTSVGFVWFNDEPEGKSFPGNCDIVAIGDWLKDGEVSSCSENPMNYGDCEDWDLRGARQWGGSIGNCRIGVDRRWREWYHHQRIG
jgi:hypothetical protein